tara:strand:- start:1320 stop:1505 length:186 start_codon:yes stop_codon:yes gene_type:complete
MKEVIKTNECKHYWIIETAEGRYSKGECKNCLMEKMFVNSIDTVHLHLTNEREDNRVGISL